MRIRLAEISDLPAISEILGQFHDETGLFPINWEKVRERVEVLLQSMDLFVAEHEKKLVGLLGLVQNNVWYSDDQILEDCMFYVVPEWRGGVVGTQLLRAAIIQAEHRNLPLFITVTNPAKVKGRVGEIMSYWPAGYKLRLH